MFRNFSTLSVIVLGIQKRPIMEVNISLCENSVNKWEVIP